MIRTARNPLPSTLALERRILELASDHTAAEIAAVVGRTRQRVGQILRAHGATAKPLLRSSDGHPMRNPKAGLDGWSEPSVDTPVPLRRLRLRRGLTQERLAEIANVSSASISSWEDERGALSRRTDLAAVAIAGRLARALAVDPQAIAECRRCLVPEAVDLVPPRAGHPDQRAERLPFVRWLRVRLARRAWDTGDLAAVMGVSPGTVVAWGTGRVLPTLSAMDRLADVFGDPSMRDRVAARRRAWKRQRWSKGQTGG